MHTTSVVVRRSTSGVGGSIAAVAFADRRVQTERGLVRPKDVHAMRRHVALALIALTRLRTPSVHAVRLVGDCARWRALGGA